MNKHDPLSDVLRSVRLQGAIYFYVNCRDEWAAETPASPELANALMPGSEHVIAFHLMVRGQGWASAPDSTAVLLRAGDVIMFPHGDAHVLSSRPGMRAIETDSEWQTTVRDAPKPIPIAYHRGTIKPGEICTPVPDESVVICGFICCDLRPYNPLVESLPRLLHMPASDVAAWIAPVLDQATNESQARRAGSSAVLDRVSEMLFVDVVRRYLDGLSARPHPHTQTNWLAALNDVHVGRAIALLHDDVATPWTLDDLSKQVGLSRSALHERFVNLVGIAPMQYLTNWRIQRSASRLRESTATVATIAQEVGYESEAAFSRAFKRMVGQPPASWRRQQQNKISGP